MPTPLYEAVVLIKLPSMMLRGSYLFNYFVFFNFWSCICIFSQIPSIFQFFNNPVFIFHLLKFIDSVLWYDAEESQDM